MTSALLGRLLCLLGFSYPVMALAEKEAPPLEPSWPPSTLSALLFGKDNRWDRAYDDWQKWKEEHHLPISIGAEYWVHADRDERIYGNGFGIPGERGAYYYFVTFDPAYKFTEGGFLKEAGLHLDERFRDHSDLFRYYSQIFWSYEAYACANTKWGTVKAGQIVKQFGIPWDGTWWEGTPNFDGFKFDPNYGVSWNKDFELTKRFTLSATAQFFFKEDRITSALYGADAESVTGLSERNTAVVRLLPTFKLNADTTLAVGLSGLTGEIVGSEEFAGVDDRQGAWGADVTLTYKKWTLFGEFIRAYGAIVPERYVSGGPSDLRTTYRVGLNYTWGPFTLHANYSKGDDQHPAGHQHIFDAGVNTQVAKNVTLYTEYVKWNVVNAAGVKSLYDDGFELVVAWSF